MAERRKIERERDNKRGNQVGDEGLAFFSRLNRLDKQGAAWDLFDRLGWEVGEAGLDLLVRVNQQGAAGWDLLYQLDRGEAVYDPTTGTIRRIDESKTPGETEETRPPGHAEHSRHGQMGVDLNIAAKQARAGAVQQAMPNLPLVRLMATYEVLSRQSDLLNPELDQTERLRRARNFVRTYERLREAKPDFDDDSAELQRARSIVNKDNYQRRKAKLAL
jgi:hypothetical protein